MTVVLSRSELDYLAAERRKRYRPRYFRKLFPVVQGAPWFYENIEVAVLDGTADFKYVEGLENELPSASLSRSSNKVKMRTVAAQYSYSDAEILQARQLKINLQSAKMQMLLNRSEEMLDTIACEGDSTRAIDGILSVGTSAVTIGAGVFEAGGDPEEALSALHEICDAIETNSNQINVARKMAVPVKVMQYIAKTVMNNVTQATVLTTFMAQRLPRGFKKDGIIPWNPLRLKGANSTGALVAFDDEPEEGPRMVISRELVELPQQRLPLGVAVPVTMSFAGMKVEDDTTVAPANLPAGFTP